MCCLIVIFGGGGFVCGIRKDAVLGNQWTMKIVGEIVGCGIGCPFFGGSWTNKTGDRRFLKRDSRDRG